MYLGSRAARCWRSSAGSGELPSARRGIGDQRGPGRGVLPQHDGRVGQVSTVKQGTLDLAELDPEAAQLDLLVGAAQELELALGGSTAPGRRCGTCGCRAGPKGSATKRSAVSPGWPT